MPLCVPSRLARHLITEGGGPSSEGVEGLQLLLLDVHALVIKGRRRVPQGCPAHQLIALPFLH
jgi:hypothetical protein